MHKNVKTTLQYVLFAALGALLLYWTFAKVNPTQLWENIKSTRLSGLLLALAIGFTAIVIRGVRWVQLIESMGYSSTKPRAIAAVAFSYLVNLVTPRVGEVARCTVLNRTDHIPIDKLIGTVVLERVVDTLLFGVVVLVTLVSQSDLLLTFLQQSGATLPSLSAGLVLALVGGTAAVVVLALKTKKFWIKWSVAKKIAGILEGLWFGLRSLKSVKNKPLFWLYSVGIWTCYVGTIYVGFQIVSGMEGLGVLAAFFISVAAGLGFLIPVPGGFGAYHFLVSKALVVLGAEQSPAASFALIIHSGQSLMFIVTGALGFAFITWAANKMKR